MTVQERPAVALPEQSRPAPPSATSANWLATYSNAVLLLDVVALLLAGLLAQWVRFGGEEASVHGLSYLAVGVDVAVLWVLALGFGRCYEPRFLGTGSEEFTRVTNASVRVAAIVALICYGAKIDVARGFVAVVLPAGTVLLLLGRWVARMFLHRARKQGRALHRLVVVGAGVQVGDLVRQMRREPRAGLNVVGVCVPSQSGVFDLGDGTTVPIVGSLSTVRAALVNVHADSVAVAASPGITSEAVRRLSYELEGTGVDLMVAPALTSVTGTRISIRPLAGLPLLHLDEPELTGGRKLLKGLFDRSVSLLLLLLLSPVLMALTVAIRLSSPGPAVFRQVRVGRAGRPFTVWKFRSMYVDAEHRLADLTALNEHDGVLFKIRDDPRVTRVGRFLRRYSLDELPQLVNVLTGRMSLVGPRPPLPSEVERYEGHTRRRLLVKPGMTGLWQVSGRSDLSWDETVRLDLRYVESWSLGLDIALLARTVLTVFRGSGAY